MSKRLQSLAATDDELVRACLVGDIEAFGQLVERYRDAVYGLCFGRVGNFELARDLAQDAFVSAYRAVRQLRAPERFGGWLRRIAENVCKAARRGRQIAEEELDGRPHAASGDLADQVSTRVAVEASLEALPENLRVAISLFYIGGYTRDEIANFLSLPASTVKGRLRDGRAKLRKQLAGVLGILRKEALSPEFGGEVMREIRNVELRKDDSNYVVLLSGAEGKMLPIWIGEAEATALSLALGEHKLLRPMTYDLFLRALSAFGIRVDRVEVADMRENTYLAALVLRKGKRRESVDARPSDAINIAVRAKAPIFVSDTVAEKMVEQEGAAQRFGELAPDFAKAFQPVRVWGDATDRVVRTILQRAAAQGADLISIRPSRKAGETATVHFGTGQGRKEVMSFPIELFTPLRERLAQMACIRLRAGARSQKGSIRVPFAGKEYDFKIALTPSGVTIKVKAVSG
jgi:RNA polymerase sigma factor (sigma-70 family)